MNNEKVWAMECIDRAHCKLTNLTDKDKYNIKIETGSAVLINSNDKFIDKIIGNSEKCIKTFFTTGNKTVVINWDDKKDDNQNNVKTQTIVLL
jgi:uncharacterized protein (DUF2344 family)